MASRDTLLKAHTLPHDADTIAYYSAGRPAGITFVMVHGLGGSAALLRPLIAALAKNFRVIAIDLPGFGNSSRPGTSYAIEDFAACVQAVIAKEQIIQPILVGHSLGCQVVACVLAQDPRLSAKAVLIGPTVDAKKRDTLGYYMTLAEDMLYEPPRATFMLWREYLRCSPRQYFKTLRSMLRNRIEENLAASEAAVMIIRGSHDMIASHAWAGRLAAITTVAGICEVKGGAHLVHISNTEEVANICEGFALA